MKSSEDTLKSHRKGAAVLMIIEGEKRKGWPVCGAGKKTKIRTKKDKGPENNEQRIPHQLLHKNYIRKCVFRFFSTENIKKKSLIYETKVSIYNKAIISNC